MLKDNSDQTTTPYPGNKNKNKKPQNFGSKVIYYSNLNH